VEQRYESELAHSTRVLDDVDRALERLSAGTYDSCESCGGPIDDADLALDPTRRVCHQHRADTGDEVEGDAVETNAVGTDAIDADADADADEPDPVLMFDEFS
jgi:hypothetical protein